MAEEKFDKVITYSPDGGEPVEIGYMTVHKSKGLQADNVVVIGLVNDRYGFPNMVADDQILELLLADSDRYDFAEERRLFYVALARTRNRVWLVTGDDSCHPGISAFVDELRRDNGGDSFIFYSQEGSDPAARCPRCGGVLLGRTGPNGDFVGCSNYPFCDKTYNDLRILEDKKKCPECGGWLTRRVRRDGTGEFYGCTNYPKYCQYTMNLDGSRRHTTNRNVAIEYQRSWPYREGGPGGAGAVEYQRFPSSQPRNREQSAIPKCPKCGAQMVLRANQYGRFFFGCPRFPSCTGTRNYPVK